VKEPESSRVGSEDFEKKKSSGRGKRTRQTGNEKGSQKVKLCTAIKTSGGESDIWECGSLCEQPEIRGKKLRESPVNKKNDPVPVHSLKGNP